MKNKTNMPFISVDYGDMTVDFFGTQNEESPAVFTKVSDSWVVESHFHIDYELHYILSGRASLSADDSVIDISGGSFCLIPPNVVHFADNKNGVRRISVGFRLRNNKNRNPDMRSEYVYWSDHFKKIKTAVCCRHDPFIASCCEKLACCKTGAMSEIHISAVIRILFIETADMIARHVQKIENADTARQIPGKNENSDDLNINIRRCMIIDSFVAENYSQDATYDMLARLLCLSRIQCIRVVNKLTGETLGSLIKRQRMNIARQLMEDGKMSLTDIAYYVGYSSYSGFYVTYKNYYHVSPRRSADKIK